MSLTLKRLPQRSSHNDGSDENHHQSDSWRNHL